MVIHITDQWSKQTTQSVHKDGIALLSTCPILITNQSKQKLLLLLLLPSLNQGQKVRRFQHTEICDIKLFFFSQPDMKLKEDGEEGEEGEGEEETKQRKKECISDSYLKLSFVSEICYEYPPPPPPFSPVSTSP